MMTPLMALWKEQRTWSCFQHDQRARNAFSIGQGNDCIVLALIKLISRIYQTVILMLFDLQGRRLIAPIGGPLNGGRRSQ
jgi:hypothetical protein